MRLHSLGRAFEGFRQRYSDRHPPLWRQAEEFHCPKNPLLHRIHPTHPSPTLYPWRPDFFFFSLSLKFLHFPLRPIVGLMHYAASQTGFFRLSTCIYVSSMTSRGLKAHSLLSFFFSFSFFCSKVHITENFSILTTFKFSGLKDISHLSCNHRHHPSPELF